MGSIGIDYFYILIPMNKKTPKYFHYFLACIGFDILLILLFLIWSTAINELLLFIGLWIISNFINYPRLAARRYISYYQLIGLSIRQLATFYLLLVLLLAMDNTVVTLPIVAATWPFLLLIVGRLIFVFVLRFYRIIGRGYNRFIIIGKTPLMLQLESQFLEKKSYGYVLEAELDTFDFDGIKNIILDRQLNEIYCSSQRVNQTDLSKLLTFSFEYGVNIHVIPDNSLKDLDDDLDSIPLEFSSPAIENYPLIDQKNLIIKRIFDLLFSTLIILTVLSWLVPILGLTILLESRGPIFFKQPRAGRNGKYFTCLKFRSMRKDADAKQATRNDPRITKVGRVIRKLSIDEFPQFINVFRGEMSVVGPRPHVKDLNDKYDHTINNYNDRILVKPGITGLSQITGHRGETRGSESMSHRIKIDILYLKSWSLSLDLVIIFKTIIDVLFGKSKNAY